MEVLIKNAELVINAGPKFSWSVLSSSVVIGLHMKNSLTAGDGGYITNSSPQVCSSMNQGVLPSNIMTFYLQHVPD
jgi:hypothetical protein